MAEKLCLQWNDFKENVNSAFGKLRKSKTTSEQTYPYLVGNMASETTFEHWKVVFSSEKNFLKNPLIPDFELFDP